jgi:AcrR family transcriptional regulator
VKRGRPRSLTEEQIVQAALRLAGSGHLEDVSMRSLAQELGVPVMTMYNYVANKEALYELVSDHVLRPVRVPPPEEGSWEERLWQLERDARCAMGKYPGVNFHRRGDISPEAARLTDGVMSILASAGFDPAAARLAFATLFTFMIGQIELDSFEETSSTAATVESVTGRTNVWRDEVFEFGFAAVIEGLKAMLDRHGPRVPVARKRRPR